MTWKESLRSKEIFEVLILKKIIWFESENKCMLIWTAIYSEWSHHDMSNLNNRSHSVNWY
jgi:hypothetical protein